MAQRGNSSPRVTVTIPTYNRAHLLGGAIQSVLRQSFSDLELFVSDNASTDGTPEVVASFHDSRLHYVRNPTNIGVHANLSRGFGFGTAPYVTVLQDDDVMLPENLCRKVLVLERHPHVDWVHSAFARILVALDGSELVDQDTNWVGSHVDSIEPGAVVMRRLLSESYWIPYTASLFRRGVVWGERFDSADGLADDLGLALRVALRARAVGFVAEPLVATRFHPEAHSTKEGVVEFGSGAYRASFEGFRHIDRVKTRFLEHHAAEILDVAALRSSSRRWLRRELVRQAALHVGPDRRPPATWRALREASSVAPTVMLTTGAARLLASSVAGSRARAAARLLTQGSRAQSQSAPTRGQPREAQEPRPQSGGEPG
jgi:cellulose synthase/poly-beta-1,6-N-acetylglucosamine synthase-like glycosyltransferase